MKSIKVDFYVYGQLKSLELLQVLKSKDVYGKQTKQKQRGYNLYFVPSIDMVNNLIKTCIHFLDLSVHVSIF